MPETPKTSRNPRPSKPTTPENFPTSPIQPSGDYSYTLEIVMNMQIAMGKLTEAVESLKTDSKEHRQKLDSLSKDVHSAKVVLKVVGGIIAGAFSILSVAVTVFLTFHKR